MKVVVDGWAWLEAAELKQHQIDNIKRMLTVEPRLTTTLGDQSKPDPIFLFRTRDGLLGVPRGFYQNKMTVEHEELVRVSYGSPMGEMESKFKATGPFQEQAQALNCMMDAVRGRSWGGLLLKAGCGFGKTLVGLEFARLLGLRTLILVHQEFFLDQWRDRINEFFPGARVGVIRQKKCEYEDVDFAIGMLQSLAKDGGGKYPVEMYDAFGLVICDEVHRVGAASWAEVIPRFRAAYRLGLTATPRRLDGAEDVFFQHISPITYAARAEAQRPQVRMLFTDSTLKAIERGKYKVPMARLNSAQIISQLAADEFRTNQIVEQVALAVKAGRKVMVVSERLSHLKAMSERLGTMMFDHDPAVTIDFYSGQWFSGEVWDKRGKGHKKGDPKLVSRTREDLRRAESAQVIFATKQMVAEGLDIQALDVLVLSTPLGNIEQAVGRVRRWCTPDSKKCRRLCPWRAGKCQKKPQPIVMDVVDEKIANLTSKWKRRKTFYRGIGSL